SRRHRPPQPAPGVGPAPAALSRRRPLHITIALRKAGSLLGADLAWLPPALDFKSSSLIFSTPNESRTKALSHLYSFAGARESLRVQRAFARRTHRHLLGHHHSPRAPQALPICY